MPALAPTLSPPPELPDPELDVALAALEVPVVLAVPLWSVLLVVKPVVVEAVVLHSGSPADLRTTGP